MPTNPNIHYKWNERGLEHRDQNNPSEKKFKRNDTNADANFPHSKEFLTVDI